MAERFQIPAAEANPGTPRIREVRIEPGSENLNPAKSKRGAEIDISPPLEWDQKAVTGFGGRGYCVPFKLGDNNDGVREFDIQRMEKQAAELEKDLIMKELETLDFLEALGSTKRIFEDLKRLRHQQALRCMETPEHLHSHIKEMIDEHCHHNPLKSPEMVFMESKQASMNLGKTMDDLAMIQSHVESLNMKTEEQKDFLGAASLAEELNRLRLKPAGPDQEERFSAEKLTLNPQCEQVKMVTETNDTTFHRQSKTCLKTAEIRLTAARKMEEAARAAEALAIAEMTILSSVENQDGLCSLEPPTLQALMEKDLSTDISRIEILRKLEEANEEVKQSKQALETALNRVEIARVKQLEAEDAFRQWNIESWKDQKAIRGKRSMKGDNFPRCSLLSHIVNQQEPLIDLSKPVLKRNVSTSNVLNRNQVSAVDDKQLVIPRRKFRFIHSKVSEQSKQKPGL
ncbi:hypothetical protein EUTSA_v10005963mg [Eutrema salsugineum]|uniref:WEB family protein n=1 Tax=Eutrema salsugineum TaxID=72664 RepID=V4NEE9_EUTSA|nr:WEB family protein At3g56270 [Eutrema salsugineum]ESQ44456.1 hypothetical protein EUTSA_v10005963mg [Eutrema salsugineum]